MSEAGSGLVELIQDTTEGVYVGSGAYGTPPTPTTTPAPVIEEETHNCWVNWQCTWTGHNNGHHSVCHVSAQHCGDHSGSCLEINFGTNFTIAEVKNASGLIISNVGTHSFTLTRNNHFNANDNIGFNFEIVTSDILYDEAGKPLAGAIGTNNAFDKQVTVDSYRCS